MKFDIPETMRALHLTAKGEANLRVVQIPVPVPKKGQVLVKVEAAPVNPSDTALLKGKYGISKEYPFVPGLEGAGVVVAAGGGPSTWNMVGKRVACAANNNLDGTYAEYVVCDAMRCVTLGSGVSFQQGCSSLVNPMTAIAFLDIAKSHNAKAIVQTAAASALGRMVISLFKANGIETINVVRKDEHVDLLKEAGASYAINSNIENFGEELRDLCKETRAIVAFDAVSGDMAGQVLGAMPKRSTLYVYGGLSGQPMNIPYQNCVFQAKEVKGFWLSEFLKQSSMIKQYQMTQKVQSLMGSGVIKTTIAGSYGLEGAQKGIRSYIENMSAGKVLITPAKEDAVVAKVDLSDD